MESSAHSRVRDDAAMPNGSRSHDNDQRNHREGHELGMNTSRRSMSPAAAVVNRSQDKHRSRARGRSVEPPSQPGPQRRQGSHVRSPNRTNRPHSPLHSSSRGPRDGPQNSDHPRGRDPSRFGDPPRHPGSGAQRTREGDADDAHRGAEPRHRGASRSPSSNKRPRSPSPSFGGSQPKKSRRDRSPRRREKGSAKSLQQAPDLRGASPAPREPRSPERLERRDRHERRRSRQKKRSGRPGSPSPAGRSRSRSLDPRDNPIPRGPRGQRQRSPSPNRQRRDLSPPRGPRHRSRPRQRTPPPQWGSRPPTSSDAGSHRRPSFDPSSSRGPLPPGPPPPRSPRDRRKPRKRGKNRNEQRPAEKFDPASGANSIEVNMVARGGTYRGGFNPPLQPGFPGKGQYHQGNHDTRPYSQASGHGTPNSSHHGSPHSQSPYGSGNSRPGWNGSQPQFSPQSQYPPQYPHSNFGPPTAPASHFHANQAHSPPYPPTGPASQYSGPYRGGHRNGSGGFRGGGQFGAGRGAPRGGFKNTQWNSNGQGGSNANNSRNQPTPGEEGDVPSHAVSQASPNSHVGAAQDADDVPMADSENPFRPSKDLQVEDTSGGDNQEQPEEEHEQPQPQMPPPSRPPPTGPQAHTPNKFSFSMKSSSKPAVAAPRPEISSKFNAAPAPPPAAPREPASKTPQKPATAPRADRERAGLPKNVPTEPASARGRPNDRRHMEQNRHAEQNRHMEQSRHPEPAPPRTRKVMKTMKRLKQKPILPPDLAQSKSVFFRKPGNESVIGSGTYGKVFKGVNVYTKKLVALKRIRMEGEKDGFPVTAVREIKLLRSLSHKNIVNLQEVMVETNECFMVFEYLSHDLTGLLNHPNYTLDAAHKKHLAQQLFEGLDYLHTRGVLHRDIKAANILVSNEGVLKLADFGLARFYAKHHQLDYTNRVITIWYRSPELLLGETQYGPAVDIWSAACVMVEIFTKRAVFPGEGSEISQLDKIYSVLGTPNKTDWPNLIEMPWFELLRPNYRKPNVFAEKYKDHVTPAAFDLLAAMFRYDPAKRPTAAEVLQHEYFTTEQPPPRQAIELKDIDGEWHEFESKALRRENEKKEKEARRAAMKESSSAAATGAAGSNSNRGEKDRKRPNEAVTNDTHYREAKRAHVEDASNNKQQQQQQQQQVQQQQLSHRPPQQQTSTAGAAGQEA
ncbi:hypothetical protein QBC46DRAFT_250491 [Diplogelasinospora grovesii]|uniref:cyclin-dependent kinase n=1 Tax=Diplogelasinospora grovesii TaxID=303347 RepID=A0AAN6NHP8_9PEZI|nr:hypothetical protein QBC46DRAFT_250491 [Diplogelasinospora grovesii]